MELGFIVKVERLFNYDGYRAEARRSTDGALTVHVGLAWNRDRNTATTAAIADLLARERRMEAIRVR